MEDTKKSINIWHICVIFIFITCVIAKCYVYNFRLNYPLDNDDWISLMKVKNTSTESVYGKSLTGAEHRKRFFLMKDFSHIKSFVNLYLSSNGDRGQSNFYYFILLFLSYFMYITDANILQIIFAMNLLIFPLSYYFMYKTLKVLYPNSKYLIPVGLFITFINPMSLTSSIFRIYDFQLLSIIFLIYAYLNFTINKNENYKTLLFALFLCTYISYTGFLFSVLVFCLILLDLLSPLFKKVFTKMKEYINENPIDKIKLIKITSAFIFSIILTLLFFPGYYKAFLIGRSAGFVFQNVSDYMYLCLVFQETFKVIHKFFSELLFFEYYIISVVVLSLILLISQKTKEFRIQIIYLFLTAFVIVFCIKLANASYMYPQRYNYFMLPMLILFLLELLHSIEIKILWRIILIPLMLFSFIFPLKVAIIYYYFGNVFGKYDDYCDIPILLLARNNSESDMKIVDMNKDNTYIIYEKSYFDNNIKKILKTYPHCQICTLMLPRDKSCYEYNNKRD